MPTRVMLMQPVTKRSKKITRQKIQSQNNISNNKNNNNNGKIYLPCSLNKQTQLTQNLFFV